MRTLLIQAVDASWQDYLSLTYARHAAYARACGADYLVFTGLKDASCHPSWNKIALLLDGMTQGYDKLVWLDADTLVVDPAVNIWRETTDAPLQMARWDIWMRLGQPHCNAGVLVVTASDAAHEALTWVWDQRHAPPKPHHIPQHWEQSWLADWVDAHPEHFGALDKRFNAVHTWGKVEHVVIQAWHGLPNRLEQMRQRLQRLETPDDAMPDDDWVPGDPWRSFLASRPKGLEYFPSMTRFIRDYEIQSVVEIGVRAGYGLAAMLRANPTLRYLGIDTWQEWPGSRAHAERLAQHYADDPTHVSFLTGASQSVASLPQAFDLAYIDGEHTDEACSSDLALCAAHCTYLLCDDYDYSQGVRAAVQRFCQAKRIPLTYLPTVHGWALMDMRLQGTAPRRQRFSSGAMMRYIYDGPTPTYHPRLGVLTPGIALMFPDSDVATAEACVATGLLRRLDEGFPAEATDEDTSCVCGHGQEEHLVTDEGLEGCTVPDCACEAYACS